jgi:hypothetical protein
MVLKGLDKITVLIVLQCHLFEARRPFANEILLLQSVDQWLLLPERLGPTRAIAVAFFSNLFNPVVDFLGQERRPIAPSRVPITSKA